MKFISKRTWRGLGEAILLPSVLFGLLAAVLILGGFGGTVT